MHTLCFYELHVYLWALSLSSTCGICREEGKALMHLTDYPDPSSPLLLEWMVMSVISREQRHSVDHTVPFALV